MTTTAPKPVSILPKQKTPPSLSLETSKLLVYGPPGIGKSTLAASIDPDRTLFLATEPGLGGLEVFQREIRSSRRARRSRTRSTATRWWSSTLWTS
jgi:SpoVK/Ycf46/Vps4 family AAA+-type ATPase